MLQESIYVLIKFAYVTQLMKASDYQCAMSLISAPCHAFLIYYCELAAFFNTKSNALINMLKNHIISIPENLVR